MKCVVSPRVANIEVIVHIDVDLATMSVERSVCFHVLGEIAVDAHPAKRTNFSCGMYRSVDVQFDLRFQRSNTDVAIRYCQNVRITAAKHHAICATVGTQPHIALAAAGEGDAHLESELFITDPQVAFCITDVPSTAKNVQLGGRTDSGYANIAGRLDEQAAVAFGIAYAETLLGCRRAGRPGARIEAEHPVGLIVREIPAAVDRALLAACTAAGLNAERFS